MNDGICKICGKGPFSRLDTHIRQSHNMTREEYDSGNNNEELEELEELEETENIHTTINKEEQTNEIFKGVKESKYPRDLDGFLGHFNMTEKELVTLVKRYKDGSSIDVTQTIKNNFDSAEAKAKVLIEQQGEDIETSNLYVAEVLNTKYNYEVLRVTSKPKKWILKKVSN